jgi:Putative zinc-finger
MDCKHIDEHLIDFLYQELEPDQLDQIEGHLKGCDRCSAELAAVDSTRSAMRELPELEPPPSLSQALMREAARAVTPADEQGFWERLRAGMRMMVLHPAMTAAVMLVLVVGVSFMVYRGGGPKSLTPRADDLPPVSSPAPATGRLAPESTAAAAPGTQQLKIEGRPNNNELGRLAKKIDQPVAAAAKDKTRASRGLATVTPTAVDPSAGHEEDTRDTITKGSGKLTSLDGYKAPKARPRRRRVARTPKPDRAAQPATATKASLVAAKGDKALDAEKCELAFRRYDRALRADKSLAKRLEVMVQRCMRRVGSQQLAKAQKRYPTLAGWFQAEARKRAAISRKRQADQNKAAPPTGKSRASEQRQAPAPPQAKPPK